MGGGNGTHGNALDGVYQQTQTRGPNAALEGEKISEKVTEDVGGGEPPREMEDEDAQRTISSAIAFLSSLVSGTFVAVSVPPSPPPSPPARTTPSSSPSPSSSSKPSNPSAYPFPK